MDNLQWVGVVVTGAVTLLILGGFAFIQRRNTILQENQNQIHREFLKELTVNAVASVSREMAALRGSMSELGTSIDKERDERIENQKDISGIQENVKTCFRNIDRVESNLKDHVDSHKRGK